MIIKKNDYGTIFRIAIEDETGAIENVSGATTKEIIFKKPDGKNLTGTAVFTNDGTDGEIEYKTVSGDIDLSGDWKYQGHIVTPSGAWRTKELEFTVDEIL